MKQWAKIFRPKTLTLFFYSILYLDFLRPSRENILKIVCIILEKSRKWILQFDILFLASSRSCLQFQWNISVKFQCRFEITWPTVDSPVTWFPYNFLLYQGRSSVTVSQKKSTPKNVRKLYMCWRKEIYFLYMWIPTESERYHPSSQKPSTTICKIAQNFMIHFPPSLWTW